MSDVGKLENLFLPRRQQLLAGKLGRGVQIQRRGLASGVQRFGGEGVQVRLGARGDLQGGGLDLLEALRLEPGAEGLGDAITRQQEGAAVLVDVRAPPGRGRVRQGL